MGLIAQFASVELGGKFLRTHSVSLFELSQSVLILPQVEFQSPSL